jgi:hypothetical protein
MDLGVEEEFLTVTPLMKLKLNSTQGVKNKKPFTSDSSPPQRMTDYSWHFLFFPWSTFYFSTDNDQEAVRINFLITLFKTLLKGKGALKSSQVQASVQSPLFTHEHGCI